MLIGTYEHNMDEKGRLFVPAKMREELGDKFILTKGIDRCLSIYSADEWDRFLSKFDNFPAAKVRNLKLYFCGGATLVKPDSQGRVVIPQKLKEHAQLVKSAVIIGTQDHAEIWDRDKWNDRYDTITSEDVYGIMDEINF